jgi:hypothetical protein
MASQLTPHFQLTALDPEMFFFHSAHFLDKSSIYNPHFQELLDKPKERKEKNSALALSCSDQ